MSSPSWQSRAACRGVLEFFSDEPPFHLCAGCPVRAECLREGLYGDEEGAWGGLTEEEIRALRGDLGLNGCGTMQGYGRHRRLGQVICPACTSADRRRRAASELASAGAGPACT